MQLQLRKWRSRAGQVESMSGECELVLQVGVVDRARAEAWGGAAGVDTAEELDGVRADQRS